MKCSLSGFKKFFEEMDPSMSKEISGKKQGYFDSLEDEEGLTKDQIPLVMTGEPWVSSHFPLGKQGKEIKYKLQPWQIVKGSMSPAGADIKLLHGKNLRSYLKGNTLNKGYRDGKRYFVKSDELQKFLTTGWEPAVQAGGGGGAPPG